LSHLQVSPYRDRDEGRKEAHNSRIQSFFRKYHLNVRINLNIDARSLNHFCRRKSSKYHAVCVRLCSLSYPACTALAFLALQYFFHIISQMGQFSKKKYRTQNVFWFSLQILSEKCIILRRIKL
jgi:hypothetical protein